MIARLAALLASLAIIALASVASAQPRHVRLELVPSAPAVAPGSTVWVAIRQRIEPGWHTYWRNPGDSGQATQVRWTPPAGWRAGDIQWPAPSRERVGSLMNYGYTGEVWLPVALTIPADAARGPATLRAAVALLVCSDVCVPEDSTLTLTLPVAERVAEPDARGREVIRRLDAVPRPANVAAAISRTASGALRLALAGPALRGADAASAWFFPFAGGVIDHAAPQRIERGASGLTLTLTPGAAPAQSLTGVLTLSDRAFEVAASPGPPPSGSGGLGPAIAHPRGGGGIGLAVALALAFLGGLILNLMPCVFPILALKAAQLARHAPDRGGARLRGLAYTAGVMATFAALAGAVIALRSGGDAVGWGFQLQSPAVVAALALLMLLITLNLLGVFQVGASVQSTAGAVPPRNGLLAAFGTGVLAVMVAAPCTAPFMAGAIGWALTQDAASAIAVFLALGFGLALPYLLLSLFPALVARLPKPGRWMVMLQRALAVPMALAALWLLWLLQRQVGDFGLRAAVLAASAVVATAWLWGQRQRGGSERIRIAALLATLMAVTIAGAMLVYVETRADGSEARSDGASLPSQPWSPERLAALRAQGRSVLVNFTADWCVTCQVNERLALSSDRVRDAVARTRTAYLVADWTRRDPAIAAELAAQGRAGVPLYLLYPRGDGAPETLPQLLDADDVAAALERAAR